MTSVLGTPVRTVDSDGAPAVLISDLHVPADGGAVLGSLYAVLSAARGLGAAVYVLGDLFDTYVSRRQVGTGVWRDVAAAFAEAQRAGVGVTLLHGNRDFLLGAEFAAAAGATIVPGGLRIRLDGVDTLLLHGDELCQNDLPYQRAKRWLRSPAVGWIARRLPLGVALAVAERARRRSRAVIARGDQGRFLPTAAALACAFATGAQRLVFGHIHRFAHGRAGGEYWVLPAFDAQPIGYLAHAGTFRPVRFSRQGGVLESVPTPAELPLAAPS